MMDSFNADGHVDDVEALMDIEITIVEETLCPGCGGGDEFHNRPKVDMDDGWWWRCYNPACKVGYYNPDTRMFEPRGSLAGHWPYEQANNLDGIA